MLDPKFIAANLPAVERAMKAKKEAKADLARIRELEEKRKRLQFSSDELKRRQNDLSQRVAKGRDPALVDEARHIKAEIAAKDAEMKQILDAIREEATWVPNIPASDVPEGPEETHNRVVRTWGRAPEFSFKPRDHVELAEKLGLVDLERARKITGSHWILFRGPGARLERALIHFMLDVHTREHGYTEISPPYLVNRDSLFGTGQLPKLENDMYRLKDDDLFLIPTAEVPVTNIFRDDVIELPVRFCAYSACFRREAGAYGAETRGITRVHQFDKVELVRFVRPEVSFEELENLVRDAEAILQRLNLHYRVVLLSSEGTSFASAKTYDLEVWAPGLGRWLEASSVSNFTDFQARRSNIRFRDTDGKLKFAHTLNGSGVALPRTFIAILEQFQREDGSVSLPEAVRPYMDGREKLK